MNGDELWLMAKDHNNKRIKMHIKFDLENYVQSNISGIYDYINYAFGIIDDKNLAVLSKGIDYDLTGLKELSDKQSYDDKTLNNTLYSLENNLIQIVEWVCKTMDWQRFEFINIRQIINSILFAKILINRFDPNFRTEQQALLVDNDIIDMINKFNEKLNISINNNFPYYNTNYLRNLLINVVKEE